MLGPDAGGLSASTVARLTEVWADEHAHWLKRDLSARHYVYFWADGIHVQARLEDDAQCLQVIIGATPEGKKELVGLIDGVRESAQSWRALLLDLKRRGLAVAPDLAIADGALGFWKAIDVATLSSVAHSDGLHPDEREMLEQHASRFGVDLDALPEVPEDLSNLPWVTRILVYRDAYILALADGSLSSEED